MSHPQAYHTSCREGLGGHSGFQFNAASPRIAANLLAALASAHAGYRSPRDYPLEPTPEQLQDFPIALKCCPVEGVPVISQTAYVGREFRGREGEPDIGRFGNYFTHIVLGNSDAADPFDGLLPIELWRAPHWRTSESSMRELPELSVLAPGACDLEWALATLVSRREWLAPVLDTVLLALHDGPRVVLVESDTECAAAWVAWVSYALPSDLAPRLSFSTFDGQPRHARQLHMCVTTPGSDVGFAEYELGREVTMLQPLAGDAPPVRSLYARVAETLLAEGAESVLRASRAVGAGPLARRGAELAVVSGRVVLAQDADDVVAVLELLAETTARGEWPTACAIAAELPDKALEEGVIRAWWRVHAFARDGTNEAAREVVDAALARLLPALAWIPEDLAALSSDAPTTPSPGCLASWLETVEQSSGARRATLLWGGVRLGLIGCNVALDRRVAAALCAAISEPEVDAVFARLADERRYADIVEDVVSSLARDAFCDERALPLLRGALAHPSLRDTVDVFARGATDFNERTVWERLRVEADPSAIRDALLALIPIAQSQERNSDVKAIFGASGPRELGDYVTLLGAYAELRALPSREDLLGALGVLGTFPLADADARELFELLVGLLPEDWRLHPVFRAWCAVSTPSAAGFAKWSEWVADAAVGTPPLSAERRAELEQVAGDACASWLDMSDEMLVQARRRYHARASRPHAPEDPDGDYREGVLELARAFAHDWPRVAAQGLQSRLSKSENQNWLIANAFLKWRWLGREAGDLLETALPEALRRTNARRLEAVEELLDSREREDWLDWLERHPPREGIARSVSRFLRRDGSQQ